MKQDYSPSKHENTGNYYLILSQIRQESEVSAHFRGQSHRKWSATDHCLYRKTQSPCQESVSGCCRGTSSVLLHNLNSHTDNAWAAAASPAVQLYWDADCMGSNNVYSLERRQCQLHTVIPLSQVSA